MLSDKYLVYCHINFLIGGTFWVLPDQLYVCSMEKYITNYKIYISFV